MAYRVSENRKKQLARMRDAKALKRESGPASDYPRELPLLHKRIVITNYDFGESVGGIRKQ